MRPASRRRASGSCPDSTSACGRPAGRPFAKRGRWGMSAYSSRTTWAIVPPAPKELTPARRGNGRPYPSSHFGQGAVSRCTRNGTRSQAIFGLSSSACRDGANVRCRIWSTTFVRPAMPAAAST